MIFTCDGSRYSGLLLLLFCPHVMIAEHTDCTGFDSNGIHGHSGLLQHFVQSCLLDGSWRDLLLVSQKLKLPFVKKIMLYHIIFYYIIINFLYSILLLVDYSNQ